MKTSKHFDAVFKSILADNLTGCPPFFFFPLFFNKGRTFHDHKSGNVVVEQTAQGFAYG